MILPCISNMFYTVPQWHLPGMHRKLYSSIEYLYACPCRMNNIFIRMVCHTNRHKHNLNSNQAPPCRH